MSRQFVGNVSIVLNTRGEIALKRDPEGKFNASTAHELYDTMMRLAKRHKAGINKYSLFVAENGKIPVLLANRFGNPYIALLPDSPTEATTRKRKVTKLA